MLSSKANAALARLKEIEEKYKMKRREQKWKEDTDSSISSVSIIASEDTSAKSKESPKKATKPKLDIKMPDARLEGCAEETKLSSNSEKSTPDKVTAKLPEDAAEVDLYVTTSLDDKSSRSTGKQESLISDIKTIQENSSIESVPDDSVTPSKSLSRSKTPRRNSSTTGDRSSEREERTRAVARSEAGKESGKSSEISRGKAPSDNSSIAKRSRLSGKPNERVSNVSRPGPRKRSIEDKAIAGTPNEATSVIRNDSSGSETLRDNSIIEESIGTVEDVSEIISELSRAEESFAVKIGDSVDVPESSKHLTTEIASLVVSNSSKHLIAGNGYANDTFEDISSSTVRSKSGSQRGKMIDERKEAVDGAEFNAKEIDIAEHKSYQASAESHRKKQVIEIDLTPKPSATKVGPRPSTYVSDFESTIANPVNVIKLPNSASSRSKDQRRHYQHRKESFRDENVSSAESSRKNISDSSESSIGDVTKMDEKKNSPGMTTVRQESGRKERGEASNRTKERALRDITGLSVVDDEDRIESVNSNSSSEEQEEERQDVSKESLDQRISQDAEYVMRKLHKDAINALAKRHASSKSAIKPLKSSSVSKIESEVLNTSRTRKVTAREENESCRPSEKDKVSDHNDRECNTKRKKKGAKITNKKSTETRNSTGSRKEDKALRFDGRQTRRLRRRIVELRLQQEREDLQKYLHELKDLRLESGSTRSYFKPLEFPKIAEFAQPDINYSESKPDDQRVVLRERVLAIRQWLKDQYVLYRDYCTMAQAINAHYVPTTLEDAKKAARVACAKVRGSSAATAARGRVRGGALSLTRRARGVSPVQSRSSLAIVDTQTATRPYSSSLRPRSRSHERSPPRFACGQARSSAFAWCGRNFSASAAKSSRSGWTPGSAGSSGEEISRKDISRVILAIRSHPFAIHATESGMARQQTVDRNIPHLRDIFGFGSKWENSRGQAEEKAPGHDSAVSVGSTSGEEESPKNSKKKKSRRRDNSKTLTESDVKHLERHLSMKKTIRKKIMRDLQQAFVEDPNEFRVDDIPPEQLKAEINIQSLSFGTPSQKQGRTRGNAESTFLDMLRGGGLEKNGTDGDRDSGHGGSPIREASSAQDTDDESSYAYETPTATPTKKSGNFWRRFTMKNRNKR